MRRTTLVAAMEGRGEAMRCPRIDGTAFGEVTVDGTTYDYDIVIRVDGKVKKRKKKLSKRVTGSAHDISREEIEYVCQGEPEVVLVGCGQGSGARVTAEAKEYLKGREIVFEAHATPRAIAVYNECEKRKAILIHTTC